ncbi:hypothetical protein OG304_06680 [Streptomyces sp. NBC_00160]|uniref:hypothetical protein n=1 Tax=Streptomyces sp. NBC_00160 TaxID=2903628 RepID=UPI0022520B42|nr:hypothetical protein [Streptomyces sp. NBC_00160]MCX5303137.1 hypothetical protein [Streptomyces sp. NBC_00160]
MPDGEQDVLEFFAQHIETTFQRTLPDLARDHDQGQSRPGAAEALRWYGRLSGAQDRLRRAEDELVVALGAEPGELNPGQWELAHRVNTAVVERDVPAVILKALLDTVVADTAKRGSRQSTVASGRIQGPAVAVAQPLRVSNAVQGRAR